MGGDGIGWGREAGFGLLVNPVHVVICCLGYAIRERGLERSVGLKD